MRYLHAIASSTASIIAVTFPVIAQQTVGNGGDIVFCPDGTGRPQGQLLDYWEGEFHGEPAALDDLGSVELTALQVVDRIRTFQPERAAEIQVFIENFRDQSIIAEGVDLIPISDEYLIGLPSGCELKQIANFRDNPIGRQKRLVIAKEYWDLLSTVNKAGLILHEAFYREGRLHRRHRHSAYARYLNYMLASESGRQFNLRTYLEEIDAAHLDLGVFSFRSVSWQADRSKFVDDLFFGVTAHDRQPYRSWEQEFRLYASSASDYVVLYEDGQLKSSLIHGRAVGITGAGVALDLFHNTVHPVAFDQLGTLVKGRVSPGSTARTHEYLPGCDFSLAGREVDWYPNGTVKNLKTNDNELYVSCIQAGDRILKFSQDHPSDMDSENIQFYPSGRIKHLPCYSPRGPCSVEDIEVAGTMMALYQVDFNWHENGVLSDVLVSKYVYEDGVELTCESGGRQFFPKKTIVKITEDGLAECER